MARCLCRNCGQEIRYIVSSSGRGNDGIIPVELDERELITERGRLVRGFKRHVCPRTTIDTGCSCSVRKE